MLELVEKRSPLLKVRSMEDIELAREKRSFQVRHVLQDTIDHLLVASHCLQLDAEDIVEFVQTRRHADQIVADVRHVIGLIEKCPMIEIPRGETTLVVFEFRSNALVLNLPLAEQLFALRAEIGHFGERRRREVNRLSNSMDDRIGDLLHQRHEPFVFVVMLGHRPGNNESRFHRVGVDVTRWFSSLASDWGACR